MQHPGVIDELASDEMLSGRFMAAEFERELEARHTSSAAPAKPTRSAC